jgi:hypothetical protein
MEAQPPRYGYIAVPEEGDALRPVYDGDLQRAAEWKRTTAYEQRSKVKIEAEEENRRKRPR